jgi:hypothetical protein
VNGYQKGVANLFFNADGTLSGRIILTYFGTAPGGTNDGYAYTNFLGSAFLDGRWSYASPGNSNRILGFISAISSRAGTTTLVTNGFSFSGTARGSRLTFQTLGYISRMTFRGIPLQATNDLTGAYYGKGSKLNAPAFTEIFTMTPAPEFELVTNSITSSVDCSTTNIEVTITYNTVTNVDSIITFTNYINYILITQQVCDVTSVITTSIRNIFPANSYDTIGGGPGYEYDGQLLVSRQNYTAFFQARGLNGKYITVYAGPFNPSTGRGSLTGTDGVARKIRYNVAHGPQ